MKKSIKCPLCGSREVVDNPLWAKLEKEKPKSDWRSASDRHRFKCLSCGHEFG